MEKNIGVDKTKVVQCIDCGEWFEVDISSKRVRCDECFEAERKRINREYYLKRKIKTS